MSGCGCVVTDVLLNAPLCNSEHYEGAKARVHESRDRGGESATGEIHETSG